MSGINECSGCGICAIACPQKVISVKHNSEGFYRPYTDENKCVNCGLCLKVCYKYLPSEEPFKNTFKNKRIYAAWSKDKNTVMSSSSGGVGFELTSFFYEKGYKISGVIFEAQSDTCKHIVANSKNDLERIQTSKYLQSFTVDAFSKFNNNERYVVIGTPCQIFGLRKYIQQKKIENDFILVDFFCHGTPSFHLWRKYKEYICDKHHLSKNFENVNFRSKKQSTWKTYSMLIIDENNKEFLCPNAFKDDLFMKLFLNNTCLNESCYTCQLRLDHCESDIRIADFWGPKYADDNIGVSMVITNTERGMAIWKETAHLFHVEDGTFEDLNQSQETRYLAIPRKRKKVLRQLGEDVPLDIIYDKYIKASFIIRSGRKIKRKLNRIIKTNSVVGNIGAKLIRGIVKKLK